HTVLQPPASPASSPLSLHDALPISLQLLGPLDHVGVVAFDTEASWVVPLGPADDRARISALVAGLRANGGTDIYAGLLAVSRVRSEERRVGRECVPSLPPARDQTDA